MPFDATSLDVVVKFMVPLSKVKAVRLAKPVDLVVGVKGESVALQVFCMDLVNH